MKNFNVYDPMKQGEGLVLDGQTLAHIEVCIQQLHDAMLALMGNEFQVLINNEGTEEGTLLKLLSRCVTPFGMWQLNPRYAFLMLPRQTTLPYMAMHATEQGRRN